MDIVNAIAKARFASAKPQRVQLHKDGRAPIDLLCMEPGQSLKVSSGSWAYYVVTGTAEMVSGSTTSRLPTGQIAVAAKDEPHTITAAGEQRLVCLAIGRD
jgi:mannose-6-phosphate isomerase-like protein (cupin superfamily)